MESLYNQIINVESSDPFSILGMHLESRISKKTKKSGNAIVIRVFMPNIKDSWIVDNKSKKKFKMDRVGESDLFEKVFLRRKNFFKYHILFENGEGHQWTIEDPYRFLPTIGEIDIHLLKEGTHYNSYNVLGAQFKEMDGINGVSFIVWAPSAKRVSVIGNFNSWDGRVHQMRNIDGFWQIFIPNLVEGELYKYEIKTQSGELLQKQDPYAFFIESAPKTASIVKKVDYNWTDSDWLKRRGAVNALDAPINIYELHLGSWKRDDNNVFLNYRDIAHEVVSYVKDMGYTHIELLPITEHPFYGSWGYQVTGYFAPTSRYGSPEDFAYFVDYCHKNDIAVILDWVPAHFPKDEHGLAKFEGTALYEHEDPRQGEHKDWGTLIFNFGRYEVKNFLIGSALFWLDKYHLDGLRVDAVASMLYLDYSRNDGEWIPNKHGGRENLEAIEFLKTFNETVYKYFPDTMTIAEESTSWPSVSRPIYSGGLGFGYKWNMGWMHDILDYMKQDTIYRKYHQSALTFSLWYAFHENFMLALSHDEVVHGKGSLINKMSGDTWQKLANLRLLYLYMYTHPGKKLTFMGMDIAQWREWNHDTGLDWFQLDEPQYAKFNYFVKDLNHFYKKQNSLFELDFVDSGFKWIDFKDSDQSIVSYIRFSKDKKEKLIVVLNFTPVVRENYRVGVPDSGDYEIVLNSDSEYYGGSNVGNSNVIKSQRVFWQEQHNMLEVTIPPLGGVILKIVE